MSTGAVLVAPAVAPAVAGTVIGAAAVLAGAVVIAGTAVLVVRAATVAVDGAARVVGAYGEKLATQADARAAAEVEASHWQHVLSDVVHLNARLRMLAVRAAAATPPVEVPARLDVTGNEHGDVVSWLRTTQRALRLAQEKLDQRATITTPARESAVDTTVAEALAAHREALRRRYTVTAVPAPAPTGADLTTLLATLDSDANDAERARVLALADACAEQPALRGTYRSQLHRQITEVNRTVARRRLAAQWLAALEERPVVDVLGGTEPPQPLPDTVRRLRAVVAGDEDLTDELRAAGTRLLTWAEEQVTQHFLLELVRESLTGQGYQIDESVVNDLLCLRLNRSDWKGEHTADLVIDRDGAISAWLVREQAGSGDDAAKRDRTRCAALADSFDEVSARITAADRTARVDLDRNAKPQLRTAHIDLTEVHEQTKLRSRERKPQ